MDYKFININLIPNTVNPSPDYYCTWQTQLYATSDGKPAAQRAILGEKALFDESKPFGWAYFYEQARGDLYIVLDDSWDVPLNNDTKYYGSLILNDEKFPTFTNENDNTTALKSLTDKIKLLGWKGLGGWVCAQKSKLDFSEPAVYWKNKFSEMHNAGVSYWKVDWGEDCNDIDFRRMLTTYSRKYAPNLVVEHAITKEIIPESDVFRTYDVPAIMSIPMTLNKIAELSNVEPPHDKRSGLVNCEDEVYIAAALGFTMGVMRHPYRDEFPNGSPDMSFPAVHRNLKTKMFEVIRAVRWHRIAPAFSVSGEQFFVDNNTLKDSWQFKNIAAEIEEWWTRNPLTKPLINNNIFTVSAPQIITRNAIPPTVQPNKDGLVPFCVASLNPNGVFSIATLGRTIGRDYFIPKCDITANIGSANTIGVFGEYKTLTLNTDIKNITKILLQDLADDKCFDITNCVDICGNNIKIGGEIISKIGTLAQPENDTSEPGVIIKIK